MCYVCMCVCVRVYACVCSVFLLWSVVINVHTKRAMAYFVDESPSGDSRDSEPVQNSSLFDKAPDAPPPLRVHPVASGSCSYARTAETN